PILHRMALNAGISPDAANDTGANAADEASSVEENHEASSDEEAAPEMEERTRASGRAKAERRLPKQGRPQIQALILSPTRELAQQIEDDMRIYGKELPFSILSVVGGLPIQKQMRALRRGVDILIATPGRLLDLLNRRALRLN